MDKRELDRQFFAIVQEPKETSVDERILRASEDEDFIEAIIGYKHAEAVYSVAKNPDTLHDLNLAIVELRDTRAALQLKHLLTTEQIEVAFILRSRYVDQQLKQ